MQRSWQARDGSPSPLGVTYVAEEEAYNFALYSKHAERVSLLLYSEDDFEQPLRIVALDLPRNRSGRIWHCRVTKQELGRARYYAYTVDGPQQVCAPDWHTFEPSKVLLDPYAPEIYFPRTFDRAAACGPGGNAGRAALGVLSLPRELETPAREPIRHESDLVIYELHVRGFTQHPSSPVSAAHRGTFEGLVDMIPYLVDLGVTAVELMPVFQHDPQSGDYWGYSPMSFFAPHRGYCAAESQQSPQSEFRRMVDALHEAGIEVLLDVVYNHTAEEDHNGPTYSFKGIDNSTYYLCSGNPERPYLDYTGTGNTLHCANRHVRRMILDSLRHWVVALQVDGFRFDLASIFARDSAGKLALGDEGAPIFGDIGADPVLASARLIAEPWDAVGTNQLGRHFPGVEWQQWNGRFRDDARRFVRGDPNMVAAMMCRMYGSDDLFPDRPPDVFHPYQSINYVTCHDGFTLYDLLAYERKHNEANGEYNADGSDQNFSSNYGHEGDDGASPQLLDLRLRQAKNLMAILMLANGIPMLRAGDEFLQTQRGNNNPYNQDNETSWLDWRLLDKHQEMHRFVRAMIAFRKRHASLCRNRFWHEDVKWFGANGPVDWSSDSRSFAYYLDGQSEHDADLYVMLNMAQHDTIMEIQIADSSEWRCVIDTAQKCPGDIVGPEETVQQDLARTVASSAYNVSARSIVVLVRTRSASNG